MLSISNLNIAAKSSPIHQALEHVNLHKAASAGEAAAGSNEQPASGQVLRSPVNALSADLAFGRVRVADAAGSAINTAKLENLRTRLEGINTDALKSTGERFLGNLGSGAMSPTTGSQLGGLRGMAGQRSKNPLNNQPSNMVTSRLGSLSNDPAGEKKGSGAWDAIKNFFGSVAGSVFGGAGTRTPAGSAAGGPAGAVGGTAFGILTANTGSADEKKNEAGGIFGIFRQGKTGTSNENASEQLKAIDDNPGGNKGEPLPESPSGSANPTTATPGMVKIGRGALIEPVNDDGSTAGGGPVNDGANGTGKLASQSQPVDDMSPTVKAIAFTRFDEIGLQARITAKITILR